VDGLMLMASHLDDNSHTNMRERGRGRGQYREHGNRVAARTTPDLAQAAGVTVAVTAIIGPGPTKIVLFF
jgi:hypothetical protein